jgi:hypothetical protein
LDGLGYCSAAEEIWVADLKVGHYECEEKTDSSPAKGAGSG